MVSLFLNREKMFSGGLHLVKDFEAGCRVRSQKNAVRRYGLGATGVTEHWIGLPHQSALMLRARITLPHFSVSSAMNFPNAADVIDIGSTPNPDFSPY